LRPEKAFGARAQQRRLQDGCPELRPTNGRQQVRQPVKAVYDRTDVIAQLHGEHLRAAGKLTEEAAHGAIIADEVLEASVMAPLAWSMPSIWHSRLCT
jgi:hypothetical protein